MGEFGPREIKIVSLVLVLLVVVAFSGWAWVSCAALGGLSMVFEDPSSPYSPGEDFYIFRPAREFMVQRVITGAIAVPDLEFNDDKLVTLGPKEPFVSWDGNEIIVAKIDGKTCVFFYTSRSFGEYVGFLWVPTGVDPTRFRDMSEPGGQVKHYEEHWYWVCGP